MMSYNINQAQILNLYGQMNQDKIIKNKFRKLVPTSLSITAERDISYYRKHQEKGQTIQQNSQPTIQSLKNESHQYFNNHKKKLKTISSMNESDAALKSSSSMLEGRSFKQRRLLKNKTDEKSKQKPNNLLQLILQFKSKTQTLDRQLTLQMDKQIQQQTLLDYKISKIITSSQLSAVKLINIYFNRIKIQYKSFFFRQIFLFTSIKAYKPQKKTSEQQQLEEYELLYLEDRDGNSYLEENIEQKILFNKDKVKSRDAEQINKHSKVNEKRQKGRSNLLNVNKFLQIL